MAGGTVPLTYWAGWKAGRLWREVEPRLVLGAWPLITLGLVVFPALGGPSGGTAILVKRHGFVSTERDVNRLKPAPVPFIELGDTGFMELNFLMTKKLSVWPNKDERIQSPLRGQFGPLTHLTSCLSRPGMVSSVELGYKVPFWIFLKLALENCI